MSKSIVYRSLTDAGRKELGYIFKSGNVPTLLGGVPIEVEIEGKLNRFFLVDWESLDTKQQDLCVHYIMNKFDETDPSVVLQEIESNGHFPLQSKYLIESYDLRMLI